MANEPGLESLYREAKSALKARDYDRASELLRQILLMDENYRDASRLLAQAVKLKRRHWYSHPLLWSVIGFVMLVALGLFIAPRLKVFSVDSPTQAAATTSPTGTLAPTMTVPLTETPLPTATPIPLTWKRVSLGQEFERDTVTALVIDPQDPEVLYVGMEHAGIFKSIDGGLSWQPAHAGLANAHVTSLLIDLEDSQILYAGTMDGIYKTENGGETWLGTGEGTHVLMEPQDSAHLYARDDQSIYKSIDSGANWELVYASQEGCPDKIYSWAIHPANGEALFIGGGETCEEGIYQSNDGGRTWTFVEAMDLSVGIGNSMLVVNPKWFSIGLDSQGNVILQPSEMVAFDAAGFNYYAWGSYLRKDNITLGIPGIGIFTNITISPFDPRIIYVGGKGLVVSRDGGLTWTELNNGLGSAALHLETGLDEIDTLYLLSGECQDVPVEGTRHGGYTEPLYISNNSGKTWDVAPKTGCHLIKDADGLTLYRHEPNEFGFWTGEAYRSPIWRSRNGGISWERIFIPRGLKTLVADPIQSGKLHIYTSWRVGLESHEIEFISEDYGHTWKQVDPFVALNPCYGSTLRFTDAYRPMAIDPRDGNHVLLIDNGALLESHDSCETTEAFATAPNTSMNSIAFNPANPNLLYAGTDEGAYISFDSGESWSLVNDGLLGATVVYSIAVDEEGDVHAATPYGIFKLEGSD